MSVRNDLVPLPSRKRSAPHDDDGPIEVPAKALKIAPASTPSITTPSKKPLLPIPISSAVAAPAIIGSVAGPVAGTFAVPVSRSIADPIAFTFAESISRPIASPVVQVSSATSTSNNRRSKAEMEREKAEKEAAKEAKLKEREEKKRRKDEEDQQKKLAREAKLKAKEEDKRAKEEDKRAKEEEKRAKGEEKRRQAEKTEKVILPTDHNSPVVGVLTALILGSTPRQCLLQAPNCRLRRYIWRSLPFCVSSEFHSHQSELR
jgi:hypothetical protein